MELQGPQTDSKDRLCGVLCLAGLLLSSYSFFRLGTFYVTAFILIASVLILYTIVKGKNLFLKKDAFAFLLLAYVFLNFVFHGATRPTAFFLISFYIITYLCSYRHVRKSDFERQIVFFQNIINVMAVYGIYQLVGRMGNLPLADLRIPGYMVEGFNWTNLSTVGGMRVFRSNAIFLEPSFFSQMLAINLTLYLSRLLFSNEPLKKMKLVFFLATLNLIAMICTLSGTGYIILFFSMCVLLPIKGKRKSTINKCIIIAIIGCITLHLFAPYLKLDVINYLLNRASEIFEYKDYNASGYLRFTGAFLIMLESFKDNLLFGCGLGELKYFTQTLGNAFVENNGYVANGIVRIGTELGLVGLVCWILFLFSVVKRWIRMNSRGVVFVICACAMNFTSESFSSIYFWMILCFVNVTLIEDC